MLRSHFMLNLLSVLTLLTLVSLGAACSDQRSETTEVATQETTAASAGQAPPATTPPPSGDVHSLSNPEDYVTRHLSLDLTVDFEQRVLTGTALLTLDRLTDGNPALVLDTRDIEIANVRAGSADGLSPAPFQLGSADPVLGSPLSITLPADANLVEVSYTTSPEASGLQWLSPRQTAGKRHPFLFTQAQAIHARSFVPSQDTPAVRMTYQATIRVPSELRAVMSADNTPAKAADGIYHFAMPQPIPSYLLALAVGDLEFQAMGQRTGVYAEAEILADAAAEFADTETMLETTEDRYGPYQWERYDLLILPPSFPFGGMENPRLSFITPTVIAGDKSLVALIAHELAHSWSGNLVTNATWRDLWLNEGFTTYLTNRIMQFVYGDERYQMEVALGYSDLTAEMADMAEADQRLAMDVRGRDPDEAFSGIPYEKGALLLLEIEQKIGRQDFDAFLLDYFNTFQFRSLTTEDFVQHLNSTLLKSHPEQLSEERIRQWIYEPGIPENAPAPTSDAFTKLDPLRDSWLNGQTAAKEVDTQDWTFHQWKYFLDGMPETLSNDQLIELDRAFGLTASSNNEIAFSWLLITIRNNYEPAAERLEQFLTAIGRNKFLRPLYQALVDADKQPLAARIFEAAKAGYHPLTVKRNSQIIYADNKP